MHVLTRRTTLGGDRHWHLAHRIVSAQHRVAHPPRGVDVAVQNLDTHTVTHATITSQHHMKVTMIERAFCMNSNSDSLVLAKQAGRVPLTYRSHETHFRWGDGVALGKQYIAMPHATCIKSNMHKREGNKRRVKDEGA